MSTPTKLSYAEGLSLGYEYAQHDLHDHAATGAIANELRAEANEARCVCRGDSHPMGQSWRAFKLGIVRGYRDAVRTLRAGRWGT